MELTDIRQQIVAGNLDQAFHALEAIAPPELLNDVQLLWSQFNLWRHEDVLIGSADKIERNRIVYATLSLVSHLEADQSTGFAARRAGALRELELDLAKGFAIISRLRKKSVVDKFLLWVQQYHGPVFQEIVREEKAFGRAPDLPRYLQQVNFAAFISANGLKSKPEDILHFFLTKSAEYPRFFSGWMEYRLRQEQNEAVVTQEISRREVQYSKLLKAGVIGGFFAVLAVEGLQSGMDKLMTSLKAGEDLYESFMEHDDGGDDGD